MSEPIAGGTRSGSLRDLARVYRRFAEVEGGSSPLYERLAVAVSRSDEALRAVATLPPRKRHPGLVLAALHDLALAGRAPALDAAYAAGAPGTAADAAVEALLRQTREVAALATVRTVRSDGTDRCAALYPAIAEAARRTGADAVGLVDVGCVAGFNLLVDRLGITYSDGRALGDPASVVRLVCRIVGGRPVPTRSMPDVVARIGVGRDPLDATDEADSRWLRACVPPDRAERMARLEAELALARAVPPVLLPADPLATLPAALARIPSHALPVVVTTWALSRLPVARRQDLARLVAEASTGRTVAWVSIEGVGVAPTVPTLGDRPASGHSIVGLATSDGPVLHTEAVGRCWSRGRVLAWLAGT